MLASGSAGTAYFDAEIFRADFYVHFLRFRHDGHGGGGSMDAPLRFRSGNALHTVHAAFIFQESEHFFPGNAADDFLESAHVRRAAFQMLEAPAAFFRKTMVHPQQVSGKQGGFIPARSGADFNDGVPVFRRVAGKQAVLHVAPQFFQGGFQFWNLQGGQFRQFRIVRLGQFLVVRQLLFRGVQGIPCFHEFLQAAVLSHDFRGLFLVIEEVRFGNDCFQFFQALAAFFNERCVIHGVCV